MPRYGKIVVIRRNGTDGIVFPLTSTSCLFGRKAECDIRMRLPWVSGEHCRISINENKEAVLTNLSAANPTKLNGVCVEQPVPLQHGDVLTIIDRSFRFEYPLQATPKRRLSRAPKDETLQVLHVQQVAEVELLHKQTSGSKSLGAPGHAECEEKIATENQQTTEENVSKALPVTPQTPKSSHRMSQVLKKPNEMTPFTKLYEKLKHEVKVKKPLYRGNASQGDGERVQAEPEAQISSPACAWDVTKGKEMGRRRSTEECTIIRNQELTSSGSKQLPAVGSAPRRSFARSPSSLSKEVSRDPSQSQFQDPRELSTPGKPKGAKVPPRPSKGKDGKTPFPVKQCSIESLEGPEQGKTCSPTTHTPNVPEGEKRVLSSSTPRRKSPQCLLVSPAKETPGMTPANPDTPRRPKALPQDPAAAPREDSDQENKGSKPRQNRKEQTPVRPVQEVLGELWDQESSGDSKVGLPQTPAPISNSKSPRRNSRQGKEFPDKSVHSEALAAQELVASPAAQKPGSGRKRRRARSSGMLPGTALETHPVPGKAEDRKESGTPAELAREGNQQEEPWEDPSGRSPVRVSAKRGTCGSAAVLKHNGAAPETSPGLLEGQGSGKTKRICQKRKSGELPLPTVRKRKRVSFGGHLSPELFDKSLPPNSPLKRGAIPARLSLPCGASPRAVLKKAQGLKHWAAQEEKISPQRLPARNCPAASLPPSGKAAPGAAPGSPAPLRKGRFSISQLPAAFPIPEEKEAGAAAQDTQEKRGVQMKTPPAAQDSKPLVTPTAARSFRGTPGGSRSRSGAVAVFQAKRRSGASSANLLVAKSWAEVVKSGVARPQAKTARKSIRKGRALKRINPPPKTPEKKIQGHFSTGHAESPATIVVGRAYSTALGSAGHLPKVVRNPIFKLNMNMDESFTGVPEMFQTPENKSGKTLPLTTAWNADFTPSCAAGDISDLHTPEESGEMMVSPLNSSDASEQKQESPGIGRLLREKSSLRSMFDEISTKTPERKAVQEDNVGVDSLPIIPEKQTPLVKSGSRRRTPEQRLEPTEVMSGIKQLFRTPEQRPEAVEVLSGIKKLLKTPKQKLEPAEALSGIKELLKTPEHKTEPVEVLSGIKELMKTPEQKLEPVEVLSGIKELMKTPKQKLEPAEVLSGIKQLMKTPKQKLEPAEVLSGTKQLMKTPKQKLEPVEVLSGVKQLMKTPKQKLEPVEVLSGIKQLMKTPRQKPAAVEDLSGIKQLLRTPQQESEAVLDGIAFKKLLKTPAQKKGAGKVVAGVTSARKSPRLKYQPVEDMVGISRIFKTPKEKVEPVEEMFGISRLVKSPREKHQPVEDFVGLQRLLAEPKQKSSAWEVDYAGMTEMFDTPEGMKVRSVNVVDCQEDTAPPCSNSSHKDENKGKISQGEDSLQKESTSEDQSPQRPRRNRPRKIVHPASAKQCDKEGNLKDLPSLDTTSVQEEMGTIPCENKGRGRRTRRCVQEVVSKHHPDEERPEIVSFVEPQGAARRPRRGKRNELKEFKHPSENLESCVEDSSVLQKEPANMKETVQECDISDVLECEGDPAMEAGPGNSQKENCQPQTAINQLDNKSNDSGIEDSEEVPLSPRKRSRGAENTEPLVPPKRGRRARNDQVKQESAAELPRTSRRLRKDPPAKVVQRDEQAFHRDPEAAPAAEPENGTKLEIKVTEKRVQSLRSTRSRKHSAEAKADTCGVALRNTQNMEKTEETSTEADTEAQAHIKNEMKVSQGYETENTQEIATEASQRLKAEAPSAETTKIPVTALNSQTDTSAVQETRRTRNRRGKKDSLEQKRDEVIEDENNLQLIPSKCKSEAEVAESCLRDSLGSVCVTKDQNSPGATSVPAANSDSLAPGLPKRTRNQQGMLKPEQTETLQENPAQRNRLGCGRGKKVHFEPAEATSKEVEGKMSLPGDGEGMTDKDSQRENSENPSQVRRGRRKQAESVPQIACPTSEEKQTVTPGQDSALEAPPCSPEANPPRRGRRREAAAAAQTQRSPSVRKTRGVLGGGEEKGPVREGENAALGSTALQAKANASTRDRRRKVDLEAELSASAALQRKCGSLETGAKGEGTQEEPSMTLETVSCAKEKPLGRGRRKETALASHRANSTSLRGKRGLLVDNGGEETPKEENVPLENGDSSLKENYLRRGRRKEIALLEARSPSQENQTLEKQNGRKNNSRQAKRSRLDNSSQENKDLSKENSRQTITSLTVGSTPLQALPEDGRNGTPGEQQSELVEGAPSTKEKSPRVSRKKTSSTSEETNSTSLREKPALPNGRGQKRILKEGEATSPENNSCQGRARQLRNNRRMVQLTLEAATCPSVHKKSELPENGNALETQKLCETSTGSGDSDPCGKGKEGNPTPQATSASRRRRCQLPADDVAPKKLRSGNDENGSLGRGKRNKTKEELGKEDVKAAQTTGVLDRKTRSSTRTRK